MPHLGEIIKSQAWSPSVARLRRPNYNTPLSLASGEATKRWIDNEKATVEFVVGYVYRSDGPCPEGPYLICISCMMRR